MPTNSHDDDLIARIFEGHDDLLEDVQNDFQVRLGEAEVPQSEFTDPDVNPSLTPILTNSQERWKKIRPSVIASLERLATTVVGDEASSILKKFDFRVMECSGGHCGEEPKKRSRRKRAQAESLPKVDPQVEARSRSLSPAYMNDLANAAHPGPNRPGKTDVSKTQACGCREPKQHRDCAYCGYGGDASRICGVCKESGIDGPMIPGTGRRTCAQHKKGGRGVDPVESLIDQFQATGHVVIQEKAPPGFEGTVRAMKGKDGIDNPYALSWWMKNKGYESHRNADGSKKDESVEEAEKSCWGCGGDWKNRWSARDLVKMKKSSKKYFGSHLCPDCYGEEHINTPGGIEGEVGRADMPRGPVKLADEPGIPVYKLADQYHACGNCGWSGQYNAEATHCPNCKIAKLQVVDHTGKHPYEESAGKPGNSYPLRPVNMNMWDGPGEYDHKVGMEMQPPEKHAHHQEALTLGYKYLTSRSARSDDGGWAMHHIYRKPGTTHELHLISGISARETPHTYNPHGRPITVTSGGGRPPEHSRAIAVFQQGARRGMHQFGSKVVQSLADGLRELGLHESVAPGYLPTPHNTNNAARPDGRDPGPWSDSAPHASLGLQDLHRRLGSALPELHALAVSTVTDERAALTMLFNELQRTHCDIGNLLAYTGSIPDSQMSEILSHYTGVVSELLGALNPYMRPNPAVARGPYQFGGQLNDSLQDQVEQFGKDFDNALKFARSRLGHFNDVTEMLTSYRDFVNQALRGSGKSTVAERDVKLLQEACSKLLEDQSWYTPTRPRTFGHDWSMGFGNPGHTAMGNSVKVNQPGHAMHGMTGRIVRQQSNSFAVEFPHSPGKVEFFNAGNLERS